MMALWTSEMGVHKICIYINFYGSNYWMYEISTYIISIHIKYLQNVLYMLTVTNIATM
jgi:hypothetical protein